MKRISPDVRSSAERPTAVAVTQITNASAMPLVVRTTPRRPWARAFLVTTAMSGPGVTASRRETPANAMSCVSIKRSRAARTRSRRRRPRLWPGGDDRKAVVVVDDREAVGQRVRRPLDGREEPEIHSALGHRGDRLMEERLVFGRDRPQVDLRSIPELDDPGLETGGNHEYKR